MLTYKLKFITPSGKHRHLYLIIYFDTFTRQTYGQTNDPIMVLLFPFEGRISEDTIFLQASSYRQNILRTASTSPKYSVIVFRSASNRTTPTDTDP